MLGGSELRPPMARKPPGSEPVLSVKDLSIEGVIGGISFTLHKGEILGVAGLVGSGRTEILRALAGVDRGAGGQMELTVTQDPGRRALHVHWNTVSRWPQKIEGNRAWSWV